MMIGFFNDSGLMAPDGVDVEALTADGVTVYVITPRDVDDERVYLDLHGGAFIVGGGELCQGTGVMTSRRMRMRVWSVDYRMPPDHPYPAAVDDCLAAYRALLEERHPEQIVIGGGSAGGNLAAAVILRARDEGLPLPAAAILLTPAMDLTHSGDSWKTNLGVDTVLTGGDPRAIQLYVGGADPRDAYVSPLFGDYSSGFPPAFLASGTRDVLLSDTVRTHRALPRGGSGRGAPRARSRTPRVLPRRDAGRARNSIARSVSSSTRTAAEGDTRPITVDRGGRPLAAGIVFRSWDRSLPGCGRCLVVNVRRLIGWS